MNSFFDRLKSRKLIMTVLAAVTGIIKAYYPDFPDQALYTIVGSLMGYVVVQGVVDTSVQLANKNAAERPVTALNGSLIPEDKYNNLVSRLNEIMDELEQLEEKPKT